MATTTQLTTRHLCWVHVSGDASLRYGQVLKTFRREKDARAEKPPLFGYIRRETPEERDARVAAAATSVQQ